MFAVALLEDDDDLRAVLEQAFQLLGVDEVVAAASLQQLQALEPRVLRCQAAVLDVNLGFGKPSGLDAATWLQRRGFMGRVVFLTGHAGSFPELQRLCGEGGMILLRKPAPLEELMLAVKGPPT